MTGMDDRPAAPARRNGPLTTDSGSGRLTRGDTTNLADILERILDKGVVIAGDIAINLVDIELLTIKLRLLIASADKAKEMGIDWWEGDPWLSSRARDHTDTELRRRIERIETAIERLAGGPQAGAISSSAEPAKTGGRDGRH